MREQEGHGARGIRHSFSPPLPLAASSAPTVSSKTIHSVIQMLRYSLVRRGTRPALIFFLSLPPSPEPGEIGEPRSPAATLEPTLVGWGWSSTLASDSGGRSPRSPSSPPVAAGRELARSVGVPARDQPLGGEPPPPADAAAAAREWCSSGDSGAREESDDSAMRRRGEPGEAAIGGGDDEVPPPPGEPGIVRLGVGGGGWRPASGGAEATIAANASRGPREATREKRGTQVKHERRAAVNDACAKEPVDGECGARWHVQGTLAGEAVCAKRTPRAPAPTGTGGEGSAPSVRRAAHTRACVCREGTHSGGGVCRARQGACPGCGGGGGGTTPPGLVEGGGRGSRRRRARRRRKSKVGGG